MKYDPHQLERFMLAALTGVCANPENKNLDHHEIAYCALSYAKASIGLLMDQLEENEVQS